MRLPGSVIQDIPGTDSVIKTAKTLS